MKKFFTRTVRHITMTLLLMAMAGFIQSADAQWGPKTQLYLVGMGTGDPDNITLRASQCYQGL